MSDQGHAEKTEQPTGKRRGEFRKRGNIPRSQDIGSVVVMSGCLALVMGHGPWIYRQLDSNLRNTLAAIGEHHTPESSMAKALDSAASTFFWSILGIVLCAMILGVITTLVQTRANFTTKQLKFKWNKFDPFQGLARQLLNAEKLQEVGLSMIKAVAIGTVLFAVLRRHAAGLLSLAGLPLMSGLAYIGSVVLQLLLTAILASAVLGAIDYLLSRMRINKQMKMTKQEVKDERKQADGDPKVKAQQRRRMFQLGYNRILAATAKADVVVVNPTHYAVALAYRPAVDAAPRLLAKGKDAIALRMRAVARKHHIPVVSNPPVARAIFGSAKVGAEIPVELYEIVAKVLAYVYRMSGRRPAA